MTCPLNIKCDRFRFTLKDAIICIAIGIALLFNGLTWWRMDALDDRQNRMPVVRPTMISVGNYASMHFHNGNMDIADKEPTVKEVFKKGGKK